MDAAPSLNTQLKGGRCELAASGSWTAVYAGDLEALIGHALEEASKASGVSIDMRDVGAFDTYGAWLLERLIRERSQAGVSTGVVGLRAEFQGLLRDLHEVNRDRQERPHEGLVALLKRYADALIDGVG